MCLALAGCESGIVIDLTVRVSPEAQAAVGERGLLVAHFDIPKSSVSDYRLGVLCGAGTETVVATLHHDDFGCAKAGTVTVYLTRTSTADVSCGIEAAPVPSIPARSATDPFVVAPIFEDHTGSAGCPSDEATLTLDLALP